MKFNLSLLIILFCLTSYSQCFDCGHSLGGHVEDYVIDIDKVSDGIVLTFNPQQGWGRSIYKYDFNCNLIWANEFRPEAGSTDNMGFYNTTVDDNNNIYSIIGNNRGGVVVDGFSIERGNSLIKLNSSGNIEWVRKISDERYLPRQVHVWNNNVFVVGQLDEAINTNIGLTVPNNFRSQYFIAKFDSSGNLMDAQQYGEGASETLHDSQIDKNGNIYFTGSILPVSYSENIKTYLNKIDSNLVLIWSKELSDNQSERAFKPMTLYYNDTNEKLYIWSKHHTNVNFYNNNLAISNGCEIGSVLMEISKDSGDLENYKIIDNCGFLTSVGNGIGNVEQRSFITHEESNLYVLSSFRGEITIGNETLTTSQTIHGDHSSDLILYKIDLTNFSEELILKTSGENYSPSSPYRDLAGPIIAVNNSLHITSSFMSFPMTINDNTIVNNSGNNSRDVLYYKHNLDQDTPNGLITFENTCLSQTTEFLIGGDFDSVLWDFDDPSSGSDNKSTLTDPSHTFISSGTYNVSALVTCGTETETIEVEVIITVSPTVNQIGNLHGCEDSYGNQISSTFDTSSVENNLIGNQSNLTIQYFDGNGNELANPLPNPIQNTVLGQETITARVSYIDNPTCFTQVTFDLIADPLPEVFQMDYLYECDDDSDGIIMFDLRHIEPILLRGQTGLTVEYFYENGQQISNAVLNAVPNIIPNQETITARVTDPNTNCVSEIYFDLIVNPLPVVTTLDILYGCDDNNDGISEYFDTSNIESQVYNGQTGMSVSYFDANGSELPSPLPNPFTNTQPFNQNITVRLEDQNSQCQIETTLELQTITQPQINKPNNLYACDQGNGFAAFDTSILEEQIIGSQSNLTVTYYDSNSNQLPSPLPLSFQNTTSFLQTINVKVEDVSNSFCYSETSFDLIINHLPEINLDQVYTICDLEPSMSLSVDSGFNSYNWSFEDGTLISNTHIAEIEQEGNYNVIVTKIENGITCESNFDFNLVRSNLPEIQKINYEELGNNFIEVIASGDGNFEYSIDGINYQESNYFSNIQGGTYMVYVRDQDGCGEDFQETTIIDYPKFFTPNNDGQNDFWQIRGIDKFPNSKIFVFDRYGKLLKQLSPHGLGWNGYFNGKQIISDDYWFKIDLGNGTAFSGHFSLKR